MSDTLQVKSRRGVKRHELPAKGSLKLESRFSYQLATLAAMLDRQSVRLLARHGLNLVEWRILTSIDAKSPCTMTDVLPFVFVDRALVSREITRLHEDGLISVEADPGDGRRKLLFLTRVGKARHDETLIDMLERQKLLAGALTSQERAMFVSIVGKLRSVIQANPGD